MKTYYPFLFFFVSFTLSNAFLPDLCRAQEVYRFEKGLVIQNQHRYGREVLFTDYVAHQLYTGNFETPQEDNTIVPDSEDRWTAIETDEEGRFRGRGRNGYLYLTYDSEKKQKALLKISGSSMLFFNGVSRAGDIYGDGWLYLPVALEKGTNEILARFTGLWSGMSAELVFQDKPVLLVVEDPTLPDIVLGESNEALLGAVVVINTTDKAVANAKMEVELDGKVVVTDLPSIPSMTLRKVGFDIDAGTVKNKGEYVCNIRLQLGNRVVDTKELALFAREATEHYKQTFVSEIDGSVQYYGVAPRAGGDDSPTALFLSVHGAGVEAIGQARAYKPKDWGVLVAPTNRRPRGFNWEDWGRIDALEVLDIAIEKFKPDPSRIYLTGHSMGGHGTWYLGATYAGKWAAIAPCAGYPTLMGYGSSDGKIPESSDHETERILLRASNPSNVIRLAKNYGAAGVYIHHGDSDRVVSVDYARQMRNVLSEFHKDFSYYEYPGGSHWFGNESVDWEPLFDYFKWHTIPQDTLLNHLNFTTANPAISSDHHWISIRQQQQPLEYSRIRLYRDLANKRITGETENVAALVIGLKDFSKGDTIAIDLENGQQLTWVNENSENIYLKLREDGKWKIGDKPDPKEKGNIRNGTFKEPFNHRMVFVYGTSGNAAENDWAYQKARFDAESWYYRANGAVEVLPDREFSLDKYRDRGIVVYGNADTNRAWKLLLADSPVQVNRKGVRIGERVMEQDDLAAYFMRPRTDNAQLSVAAVSGTGIKGLQAANANQYFAGGSGFPDYVVYSVDMMVDGIEGVKAAGFYQNDWNLAPENENK